jgi:hypothetical protein
MMRTKLTQLDAPSVTLDQAVRVVRAIADQYAGRPTSPSRVASAMGMQSSSGPFRVLCGAAVAYGLTEGGPNAIEVALTELGARIARPVVAGDDGVARKEALLRPRVVGEFLRRYDGHPLPRRDIAVDVLQESGIPAKRAERVFELILDSAASVGCIRQIDSAYHVSLQPASESDKVPSSSSSNSKVARSPARVGTIADGFIQPPRRASDHREASRRIFISHGPKHVLDPLRSLLSLGEIELLPSKTNDEASPPHHIVEQMRSCSAGIIHWDIAPNSGVHSDANALPSANLLIELGAAMALYGSRLVLIVKDDAILPSSVKAGHVIRYKGNHIDLETTMRLAEIIARIKRQALNECDQ